MGQTSQKIFILFFSGSIRIFVSSIGLDLDGTQLYKIKNEHTIWGIKVHYQLLYIAKSLNRPSFKGS